MTLERLLTLERMMAEEVRELEALLEDVRLIVMRNSQGRKLPDGWKWENLGNLCDFISGVTFDKTEVISSHLPGYLPILRAGHISDTLNTTDDLIWVPSKKVSEVQLLQLGDITMCMSSGSPQIVGKSAVVDKPFTGSVGAFCSIIRTKRVEQRQYVAYWLKSEDFMQWRDDQARGINIQNLRVSQLKDIQLPLPPLDEQKRIAAILSKANRLRHMRRYTRELSDGYLQSVFLEMFGDPVSNPRGWPTTLLGKVASVQRGRFSPRPRNDPKYYGGDYPFIQTGDIAKSNGFLRHWTQTLNKEGTRVSRAFDFGTVVIAIVGATIGETAILAIRAYCPDSVIGIRVDPKIGTSEYIEYLLRFWKPIFKAMAPETARANINLETLRPLSIPLPPLPLQQKFAQIVQKTERLRAQQREAERQAEHLFQSLLHRAFRGEI